MTLTRLALTLAAAGIAVKLYQGARRPGGAGAGGEATSMPGVGTEVGADSPNEAEQMQARGFAQTPQDRLDGGLFGSNSQQGAEPVAPGLPDFARGA
jgi:hypothetical protein